MFKISVNWGAGGANKSKWVEKIENLVIDPPTIIDGRVQWKSSNRRTPEGKSCMKFKNSRITILHGIIY